MMQHSPNMGDHVWFITSRHTERSCFTLNDQQKQRTNERYAQLIDIGVKYLVHEPDGRRLIGVLVRELDVNLPHATFERSYT